ncbi:LLM class F420-dependent oxidoreductase [Streptomyces sp. BH105]|uniref:LLM class F420-dependent oxidoreductase n=1 Tax=Streptomyces sp. BH105 TaxID=3410408 RepID=UPI003CE94F83
MTVNLGCDLPYFREASEIRDFAQAAEELGYDVLNFSEHVAATTDSAFPPGFAFEDPWHESMTLAAYLAGVTRHIGISTSMYLLPLRPTVLAAKQAAEVDLLTGGRLRLGVAVGWNEREVECLGQDPRTRGARFEEQIEVLRMLWTQPEVTYTGVFHALHGVGIHPRPDRGIPVWIGAGGFATGGVPSDRLLRRIARIGDGYKMFAPLGLDEDAAVGVVERLRRFTGEAGRDPAALGIEARLLAQAVPEDEWRDVVARWAARGVTHIGLGNRIAGGSVTEQVKLIERVARVVRC